MNSPPASKATGRLLSIDALRGIAVFLMIEQHLGVWLWRGVEPGHSDREWLHQVAFKFNALGGGAAPLFVMLAGVGSALFIARGRPHTDRTLLLRGATLMGFGLVLNLLTPSWFSWGSWFVLHMMGFSIALSPVWRRIPTWGLLALGGAVLVGTAAIQEFLQTPDLLRNPRMRDLTLPGGPLRLALAEGQFPIFPWLAFFLCGVVSGRWIGLRRTWRIGALGLACLAVGGGLALADSTGIIPRDGGILSRAARLRLGFYPAPVAMACLLMSIPLVALVVALTLERRKPLNANNPLVTLGRASLTLLMLHVVLFRELTRPVGMWQANSAESVLLIIFGFVGLSAVMSRLWSRVGYRGGAEWALRRLAP